jgi:hypothetical protein
VKHGVEVKHTRFTVANELVLECEPDLAHGDAVLLGDVLKHIGDHAEDPEDDDALHALLSRDVDRRGIKENVVGEYVALQGE